MVRLVTSCKQRVKSFCRLVAVMLSEAVWEVSIGQGQKMRRSTRRRQPAHGEWDAWISVFPGVPRSTGQGAGITKLSKRRHHTAA